MCLEQINLTANISRQRVRKIWLYRVNQLSFLS